MLQCLIKVSVRACVLLCVIHPQHALNLQLTPYHDQLVTMVTLQTFMNRCETE